MCLWRERFGVSRMMWGKRIDTAAYGLIAVLMVAMAYPALAWLVQSWLGNAYYSHGFLVAPISALLAWRKWPSFRAERRSGGRWEGAAVGLSSLAGAVIALRRQNYVAACFCLIGLLCGVMLYLEGWARLRHWLFPLLFLGLMVPLPFVDRASPWLEAFTARAATGLARAAGISAVQRGGEIALPGTTFVVGAPCSGLRSLVAMVTLGVCWVYVVKGRPVAKAVMLAVVPLVTLSNVLRVAALLGVAVWVSEQAALTYYHDWSSPVLFLTAVGLMLLLGKVLGCSQVRDDIF